MFCLFQWPVFLIHDSSSNASLSETLTQAFVYSCLFDLKRHLNHVGKWNSRLPKSRGPPSFLKGPESFGNSFQSLKSAMFDLQISLSLSLSINIYIYRWFIYIYINMFKYLYAITKKHHQFLYASTRAPEVCAGGGEVSALLLAAIAWTRSVRRCGPRGCPAIRWFWHR